MDDTITISSADEIEIDLLANDPVALDRFTLSTEGGFFGDTSIEVRSDGTPVLRYTPDAEAIAAMATYGTSPTSIETVSAALDAAEIAGLNIDVDLFSYTACDLDGACGSATVSVYYAPNLLRLPPDALEDTATTTTGSSVVIGVLDNDSDRDGVLDPDSLRVLQDGSFGTTAIIAGALVYNAGGSTGTDTLVYEVCDTDGRCSTASITVTIASESAAPALLPCSLLAVDSFQASPWTFTFQVRNTTGNPLDFEFVIPDANYELTNLVFNGNG